jgi:hypothetical protein
LNLIKREVDKSKANILNFREHQYTLLPELINLCFDYLEIHGFNYDKEKLKIDVIDDISYNSSHHFATLIIKAKLFENTKTQNFFEIVIPKLIDGQVFRLNGANYCPQLFIADSPIVLKKKSKFLYSLFCPITIFNAENRIIFLGNNIPITRFLRLYYTNEEIVNFGFEENNEDEEFILQSFSNILNVMQSKDTIIDKIDKLFLDAWTYGLYKEFYNIEPSLKNILDLSFNLPNDISFIDLNYKRLVFIEYILSPLFKSISQTVNRLVLTNINPKTLNIKLGDIISHFFRVLRSANRIDNVNGFTALHNLKASFRNPNGGDVLPKEVSSIHETFKNKICPVVISNNSPGVVVQLVPEQNLKNLKYGIFDLEKKL